MSWLASSLSPRANKYSFGHEDSNSLPGGTYGVLDIKSKLSVGFLKWDTLFVLF